MTAGKKKTSKGNGHFGSGEVVTCILCHPSVDWWGQNTNLRIEISQWNILIKDMEPQYKRQYQQGWGSTTSSCQVCHWRLPAHKHCHSHATATPVADTTKQMSVHQWWCTAVYNLVDIYLNVPAEHHLSSNQRPFTAIPGTTHKNYSVQDIIFSTSIRPSVWNQLPVSVVEGDILD